MSAYDQFCELTAFTTVRMQAQSDRINYLYDYGDGWEVSIGLAQDYYASDLEGQDGSVIRAVLDSHFPVCINILDRGTIEVAIRDIEEELKLGEVDDLTMWIELKDELAALQPTEEK